LGLKTQKEWKIFCQSGNLPQNIPKAPQHTYAGKGWEGLRDWLGTELLGRNRSFVLPFDEAKRLVRELQLKSQTEWRAYVKKNRLPKGVPSNPNRTYKGLGWISFGDWLGTRTIAPRLRTYRPFKEARKVTRNLNLKSWADWRAFVASGKLPSDIPSAPHHVYQRNGWVSMRDWLGY
jgi:hypothetical protein